MKLEIVQIAGAGVPNQERIQLSVKQPVVSLAYFVVLKTVIVGEGILSGSAAAFWFPSVSVNPGDQVILYTSAGSRSSQANPLGGTNHFFYWGLPNTLFNGPADAALVLAVQDWQTTPRGPAVQSLGELAKKFAKK
jgi:hypothetical protein